MNDRIRTAQTAYTPKGGRSYTTDTGVYLGCM